MKQYYFTNLRQYYFLGLRQKTFLPFVSKKVLECPCIVSMLYSRNALHKGASLCIWGCGLLEEYIGHVCGVGACWRRGR